ncbi:unnamed protein product [Zymoseptoria tritici ST99CH_1E4]|uniref:Ig-like domain-containing protein n=2 Tax=Zymoseptoria tritici TaxID=1047171 RepID=A0A2H1GHK8_ZYMTR|nr:unnamed protein product [Zymoseptoria tritici ST99CH_1E4]
MLSLSFLLTALLCFANANPLPGSRLQARQSQQVSITLAVSDSQFRSFENSATLKSYLQSQGYNYNLNYNQLSQTIVSTENYFASKAASTTSTNSLAPPNNDAIQTDSDSTTLDGGASYTNISATADTNLVSAFSFSDGDAASSGGAIQRRKTISSTSSSGTADSTATVTGSTNPVSIFSSADVPSASTSTTLQGSPQDALAAGTCAAAANGASASAQVVTTVTYPIGSGGRSATSGSVSSIFCESGVSARSSGAASGSGTSTGLARAALTDGGVSAQVSCNGKTTSSSAPTVGWTVNVQGTMSGSSFNGNVIAVRTARAEVRCS